MMFRNAVLALLSAAVMAEEPMIDSNGSIPVSSNAGQEILMKATVVEEARFLNNNNNQDYSWMSSYSIKYTGCASLVQVSGQGGNNNNNKNNNGQGMLFTQHLVRFSLCPIDECASSCTDGGHYVVSMNDFVDSYTEAKLEALEYQCEMVRESCYCENANDDEACETACYTNAGLTDCIAYEGDEDFEVQRYLECAEMKNNGGNNNNNNNNYNYGGDYYYGQYYIGPYCPDGKSIYLGLFYDQGCSAMADVSQYASRMGGAVLPYSSSSMVVENDCMACGSSATNDNGEVEYTLSEFCTDAYKSAAKCEESITGPQYPETTACDYIDNILPRLEAATHSMSVGTVQYIKKGKAAKAFAFIFAFTTVLFGAYAYFLYRKIKRGVVALAAQGN